LARTPCARRFAVKWEARSARATVYRPRPGTDPERHAALLRTAGIGRFSIEKEEAGHWIILGG
jgi:hypothetical protein